jgi:hypothetical protein
MAVISQYEVTELLMIPYGKKTDDFMVLHDHLLKRDCLDGLLAWYQACNPARVRFPSRGERWRVGPLLQLSVLNPDIDLEILASQRRFSVPTTETLLQDVLLFEEDGEIDVNDLSIVLFLQYGRHSFLLTGDIGEQTEKALVEQSVLRRTTVLKVAHHGSKTSTSEEFLSVVRPENVVISAGKNNSYGHPAPETVARLKSRSIPMVQTSEYGSIRAISDGRELRFFSKNGELPIERKEDKR